MVAATRTVQSSELSRNSREVFAAADEGPVLISRRDGDTLLLTKVSQADQDRRGLEIAAALVAAALAPGDRSLTERLQQPFPWLILLSPADQETFASEIVATARACAAVSTFDPLVIALHAWQGTAEAVAAGYTPTDELDWLDEPEPVRDPRA